MNLRIVFLGNFEGKGDEGFNRISQKYWKYFAAQYQILAVNTTQALRKKVVQKIISFKPHIIHYLSGPTIKSLIILKFYQILLGEPVQIIVSATRPFFKSLEKGLLPLLKPSIALTQALKWEKVFKEAGISTTFVPNPVDCNKFKKLKTPLFQLRKKYALPLDKKLILHVGHIRNNRNLELLGKIQEALKDRDIQIVIVGSTHFSPDRDLLALLNQKGCIVLLEFFEKIEEIYNACDAYAFPVKGLAPHVYPKALEEVGVVDMPLSILEALACELPVISMPIDAVGRLLEGIDKPPLHFFDGSIAGFERGLKELTSCKMTFEKIRMRIDSHYVFQQVDSIYQGLVGGSE